jgi:putative DNA primase/helicase
VSGASNYQDVLDQLRAAGLLVDALQINTHRMVRCRVEGERERRGWYRLHELTTERGDVLIVGSFGVWHGNEANAQKVQLRKIEISPEQRDALKRRIAEDRKQAEHALHEEQARAAEKATAAWEQCRVEGEHAYLTRKGIPGYEVRYSPSGALVIPLCDGAGQIHGLQVIRTAAQAKDAKRPEKDFWPTGLAKKGHYHLIGAPDWLILIAEGYATAASLHLATGHPVAVSFDAGNIAPVAAELRKRYPRARILICADDDILAKCAARPNGERCAARLVLPDHPEKCPTCGLEHKAGNAGVSAASAVSLELGVHGAWIKPTFADEDGRRAKFLATGAKLTDFNDLHLVENIARVRDQIEGTLRHRKWSKPSDHAPNTTSGAGGRGAKLKPIGSLKEMLRRFALVYGHAGTVFDRTEHSLLSLSDMRDACLRRDVHRMWMEHPERAIVRVREVGFDPAGEDPEVTCNLWAGWPTTPAAGACDRLLDLLRYLCSRDRDPEGLFQWILRWCAYPIQNPGAKMRSSLVVHGPQGSGKSFFFECVMAIYGQYGRVIGQQAVEDKFNDWASRRLYLIADEVVARSEVYHIKNQLKALITGDWIRINPKNVAAYDERNHVNIVFLSNESMPVVLEEDDRRHCVVWTPPEQRPDYYAAIRREAFDGGIAALHDYLLHLDLGDFHPGTRPPETDAKSTLIKLALDSPERFYDALMLEDIEGVEPITGRAEDWFRIYEIWCRRNNVRAAPAPKFFNALDRKRKVTSKRERYTTPSGAQKNPLSILFLGDTNPPEGEPRAQWLGAQVVKVAQQLDNYKEAAK